MCDGGGGSHMFYYLDKYQLLSCSLQARLIAVYNDTKNYTEALLIGKTLKYTLFPL